MHGLREFVCIAGVLIAVGCDAPNDPQGEPWVPDSSSGEADSDEPSSTSGASTNGPSTNGPSTATSTSTTANPTTAPPPTTDPTATATAGDDSTSGDGSTSGDVPTTCTVEELELIDLVNEYRGENGLPAIPASPSLCTVGHLHAVDLAEENPHGAAQCNLHSWSSAGTWSPCCYTSDHAAAQCMWDKPRELTDYPGNGYENAAGGGGSLSPAQALDLWKSSPGHNDVILNQGGWANNPWGAVGAGMYQGYTVLWFGGEADPAG